MPRSASNAAPRGAVVGASKNAKCECGGAYIAAGLDVSDADIVAIDEPPDLRLLEAYVRGGAGCADGDCGGQLANGDECGGRSAPGADERNGDREEEYEAAEEEDAEGAVEEEIRERLLKEREDRDDGVHSGKRREKKSVSVSRFSMGNLRYRFWSDCGNTSALIVAILDNYKKIGIARDLR